MIKQDPYLNDKVTKSQVNRNSLTKYNCNFPAIKKHKLPLYCYKRKDEQLMNLR